MPNNIVINGNINNKKADITCFIVDEIFNSIVNHILIDDLMPILKICYLSLT